MGQSFRALTVASTCKTSTVCSIVQLYMCIAGSTSQAICRLAHCGLKACLCLWQAFSCTPNCQSHGQQRFNCCKQLIGMHSANHSQHYITRLVSKRSHAACREFSGQSATSPQRSAHSLGGLPVGGLAVGRGAARGERGLSATKASGLSSSKKRGDAMRRCAAVLP